ncbi:MAG TPA: ATP-binding cassette domain-containing protein [Verrucomicrobiae bacterium]|nr:ATP-binding cassette domain-containing protein [Verrucomicrobiae bacterium]
MPVDAAAESVIRTHDLRKTFTGRGGAVEAVKGVDLDVKAGEIFGFLGPNGAGKTTTLRMLATLIPPTSGDATVAGVDLLRNPARVRERIGYVAQGGGSDPLMTGRGELVIQARLFGMSRKQAEARATEVLAALGLTEAARRTTGTYSGGMRRRLDIGMGMVHQPKLLFLDEPTTGLDPQARANLWDEVRKLRNNGTTVFLTTHYLEEADILCDRVAIIDHGTIVAEGTPIELKRAIAGDVVTLGIGEHERVLQLVRGESYVREANDGDADGLVRLYVDDGDRALPQLLRLLDGAGLSPQTIALSRPSLDDVFLRKTGRSLRETAA